MKAIKRNAVIIAVLLFVCLAVYLNWAYNSSESAETSKTSQEQTAVPAAAETQQTPYYTSSQPAAAQTQETADAPTLTQAVAAYFDSVRLSRSEARDAAVSTLTMVSQAEGAAADTVDDALRRISAMAECAVLESELESLIKAKGFADCVVYITSDSISVTVPAGEEGLSTADVARITDAVTERTDFTAAQLRITEVK